MEEKGMCFMKKFKDFLKKLLLLVIFGSALCIPYKIIGSIDESFLMIIAVLHFILLIALCFLKKTQKSFWYLNISFLVCISFYMHYKNFNTVYPSINICAQWCWLNGDYEKTIEEWLNKKEEFKTSKEDFCQSLCEEDKHLNGPVKIYGKNGKIESEGYYIDGKREGLFRRYYRGRVKMETQYSHDKRNGYEREYHNNGKLNFEAFYKNGELIKKTWYDENGNPK